MPFQTPGAGRKLACPQMRPSLQNSTALWRGKCPAGRLLPILRLAVPGETQKSCHLQMKPWFVQSSKAPRVPSSDLKQLFQSLGCHVALRSQSLDESCPKGASSNICTVNKNGLVNACRETSHGVRRIHAIAVLNAPRKALLYL